MESLVYNGIVDFVTNSISVHQFGFLRGRSTLQQLYSTLLGSSSQTDVLYLDFKKAFDSVAHNELLHKLWNFASQYSFAIGLKRTDGEEVGKESEHSSLVVLG